MPSQFSLPLDPAVVQSVGQQSGLTVSTVGTLGTPFILTDPAYRQANTGTVLAQAAFNYANTLTLGAAVDAFARANTYYLSGVDATQNTNISIVTVLAQAAFDSANNVAPKIQPAFNQANTGTVLAQASFDYANSRQNIQTSASPTFNGLTLTNALAITQGGTGATSSSSALTNLLPTGTTSGYVLTTGGPGTFYWAAGGGGGSGATPGTTINSSRLSYTANGSGFAYTTPTYTPGASQLRVYFDGLRQFASEYTETSNTICTFSTSPASGVVVLFEVDGYVNNPYYANNIAYTINSIISPTANTIQLAIDGLANKVAYTGGSTFNGPIQAPNPTIGTSNTQVATTSYINSLANSGITFSHNITGSAGSATTAGSVTNGVYTSSSYSDPSWITSLSGSKISGSRNIPQATLPTGSILQVVQVVKTNQYSVSTGTPTDVPGLAISITPSSTSSKILVMGVANISTSGGGGDGYARLMRNYTTSIGNGDSGYFGQSAGQDYFQVFAKTVYFLDSPNTTSATTYNIQVWGANITYVNGRGYNGDFVTSSSITLMEIAG
jgi:hypothetical protein